MVSAPSSHFYRDIMPIIRNTKLKNWKSMTKFGLITFDQNGDAEVEADAHAALLDIPGFEDATPKDDKTAPAVEIVPPTPVVTEPPVQVLSGADIPDVTPRKGKKVTIKNGSDKSVQVEVEADGSVDIVEE